MRLLLERNTRYLFSSIKIFTEYKCDVLINELCRGSSIMYLCFINKRNELCVDNTGHFVMETEIIYTNSTIKSQKYYLWIAK